MLVLSRKTSQRILIGENIQITVVGVEGGRVRLGIDAPSDVVVLRGELRDRETDEPETPTAKPRKPIALRPQAAV